MYPSGSIALASLGGLLALDACAIEGSRSAPVDARYRVEVLARGIDPESIPDRLAADFDGDAQVDRVVVTDSSVHIGLTSGGTFDFSVREPGQTSPRIWDANVVSLRRDRRFPSIVLATCPEPSHGKSPITQQMIYNDNGTFIPKRISNYPNTKSVRSAWPYPMRALGLDCAWLESNDLPVCFFASMEDGALGVSRLIELDPTGYSRLTADSALRTHYSHSVAAQLESVRRRTMTSSDGAAGSRPVRDLVWGWLGVDSAMLDRILSSRLPGLVSSPSDTVLATLDWLSKASPRDQARAYLHMDTETFDSLLAASDVQEGDSAVGYVLAVALARMNQEAVFSHDVTRDYGLPWPAQYGHASSYPDGMFMIDAVFLDFSGDGLLDLVAVGQHSRPFSAIQRSSGRFTRAGYHAEPDEYARVWAPEPGDVTAVTAPPCVYYGMEKTEEEASRSDYLDCYDRAVDEWYELTLPEGPYWTEYQPVVFRDMNDDGMVDFAARREDGSWTALTFVRQSR